MPESVEPEWAEGVLAEWIQVAEEALMREGVGSTFCEGNANTRQLAAMEPRTQRVVQIILGLPQPPQLMVNIPGRYDNIELREGITIARRALAVLRTAEETERHIIGTAAPTMAADGLHPLVWDEAASLWRDGHHKEAVQRAATFLNAHVQHLTGRHDVSDMALMQEVFSLSDAKPGKPRLRWPGDDTNLTVKAMRTGLLQFAQGCYAAVRNPVTHGTDDLPEQIALELLSVLSTLARWIDGCEMIEATAS